MFGISISITLFSGLCIYLAGIATVLLSVLYWLNIQENGEQIISRRRSLHETRLPDTLLDLVQNQDTYKRRETCLALNLILQFFFQERRHDTDIFRWFTNLVTQEFTELLQHRTLSKIINKMEIQDLNLGNNFPVIKSVTPLNVQFVKNSPLLRNIEVSVEIEYTGGFQIVIDAISKLSKKAVVKIKVVRLSGKGCLELCRYPFTHWSFSFYEEPESEFEVDSTVLGRQIPRFKTIIINHLKSILKRKHTLPYYKLRTAPLIKRSLNSVNAKPQNVEDKANNSIPSGMLHITLVKCSRLQPSLVGATLYFSFTLTEVPLVCAYETPVGIWIVQDIYVNKPYSSPVGILLRNADDNSQIVEAVSSKSLAFLAGLRKNDIILAVNNIPLVSGSQAAKLFTSSSYSPYSSPSASGGKKGQTSQEMCIRIKRLIFTDHKRGSLESRVFEPTICPEERGVPKIPSCPPSTQSTPASLDDLSLDSSCVIGELLERGSNLGGNLEDKHSLISTSNKQFGELSPSRCSTPASSRSSSPEPRQKLSNVSLAQFPPEEKSSITECFSEKARPSAPIQIPSSLKTEDTSPPSFSDNKDSASPSSSMAGTPTSLCDFSTSVPSLGTPVLKMDARLQSKKSTNRSRPVVKHFETPPMEGSCDPVLGNEFKFMIDEDTKHINLCVWSRHTPQEGEKQPASSEKFSSAKEVINKLRKREAKELDKEGEKRTWTKETIKSASEPANPLTGHPDHSLVGYTNIAISDLIPATQLNTQGCITKVISFEPADPGCPEIIDHPLLPHKGFHPSLCYGDIMLSIVHQSLEKLGATQKNNEKGAPQLTCDDECMTDATLSEEEDLSSTQEDLREERDHVFKRTHFNSATQCNFCKKKIWLKDAYQCSECGIICHKKCMLRCEQATVCDFGGLRYREIRDPQSKEEGKQMPEIIMTSAGNNNTQDVKEDTRKSSPPSPQSPRHTLGSLLSHISAPSGSLKRTGSAQNLAPPQQGSESGFSRSLPPSPQHTPRPSRKNSLTGNPFSSDDVEGGNLETILKRLESYPHDEKLVSLARETSHQLYSHLPLPERLDKIKDELEVLQSRVDREGEIRVGLAQREKEAAERKDSLQRTRLSLLISQCDARTQALALLTMHYFTALQTVQQQENEDVEEEKRREKGVKKEKRIELSI